MEGQNVIPMDIFTHNFKSLQYEMRTQGLASQVKPFSGDVSGRTFRAWVRDMQKVGITVDNDSERMKVLAIQTLKGPASEFVSRKLRLNPAMTWEELLTSLKECYADQSDAQLAMQKLKRVKQQSSETIQNFSERIVDLAEEAFVGLNLTDALIQQQLKDIFLDGIKDDGIARELIKDRPTTLERAVKIATAGQVTNRTFELRRREEIPMEVDRIQGQNQDRLDQLEGAIDEIKGMISKAFTNTGTANTGKTSVKPKELLINGKQPKWTPEGKPICAYCEIPGHVFNTCRKCGRDLKSKPQEN